MKGEATQLIGKFLMNLGNRLLVVVILIVKDVVNSLINKYILFFTKLLFGFVYTCCNAQKNYFR